MSQQIKCESSNVATYTHHRFGGTDKMSEQTQIRVGNIFMKHITLTMAFLAFKIVVSGQSWFQELVSTIILFSKKSLHLPLTQNMG